MQDKVDIVMATYNGAEYISQQIRSLQNQTIRNWHLLIHDDGSTDNTVPIIKDFIRNDPRIQLIEDGKCLHDSGRNFLHALRFSTAPFIIFCDQDDIWLEHKLEVLLNAFMKVDNSIPTAIACNSYMYFDDKEKIEGKATICFPRNLKEELFMNSGVQGCAIMFNQVLRDICLNTPDIIAMHDHLVTLAALTFGKLHCIDQNLMLYRRHSHTVTGYIEESKVQKAKKFLNRGKTVLSPSHLEAIKSFYNRNYEAMEPCSKEIFEDFFLMEKHGRLRNAIHALFHHYSVMNSRWILFAKLLIRPLV